MARRAPTPVPAQIDPLVLTGLQPGDAATLRDGGVLDGLRFDSIDVGGADLTAVSVLECEFVDLRAHETQLRAASLAEVVITRMDAPVLRAARSSWHEVRMLDSRVGSFDLAESSWQSVLIRGCKLGFVNLRGADLVNVIIEDCTIDELDLGAATAARVTFANTRIGTLDLSSSRLTTVDLRGADLQRIVSLAGLAGATMAEDQVQALAASFAAYLGITVEAASGSTRG